MKNKVMNRILSFALTLVLMLGVFGAQPMTAYAVDMGTKDNMVSGGVVIGTGGNTTPTLIGFDGKQWAVIGYDGVGVTTPGDTLTLLLANAQSYVSSAFRTGSVSQFANSTLFTGDNVYYADNPTNPQWATPNEYFGSTLQAAMDNIATTLSAGEQAMLDDLVIPRDFDSGAAYGDDSDKVAGSNSVDDAYFWPLSLREANRVNSTVRGFSDPWWLRSPGNYSYTASAVNMGGSINADGDLVYNPYAVRPAFKLNLASVILTSAASGGTSKPASVASSLSTAAPPTGVPLKFTVLDSTQVFVVNGLTNGAGTSTLTFSYNASTVTTGTNQYISCVLVDGSSEVKYYGKLEDLTSTPSGAVDIDFTSVTNGTYTLKLFSEQANGDNETDFASAPVAFTVNVTSGNATIVNPPSTGSGSYTPTYTRRTLTDTPTGVKVTAGMTSGSRLNVAANTLHTARTCAACDEIRARQAAGDVLALFDISLTGSHKGEYEVFIPFSGSGYYTVLHCNNGKLEKQSGLYANGGITSTWAKLSPFAVISGADVAVPDNTVTNPPKTGSARSIGGIVMALVGLMGMAVLRVARRRQTKRRA